MATSQNHRTYLFFTIGTLVALSILAFRIAFIIIEGGKTKKYQDPVVSQSVIRGTIYDRNGKILAISTPYYNLYFHLQNIKDMNKACMLVAPFADMTMEEVKQQISHYTTYALVKKHLDPAKVGTLEKAIKDAKMQNAISVEKIMGRSYPALFHAAQTIGFVNPENKGLEGIEYSFEKELDPKPQVGSKEVIYGDDLTLTLDIDIQYLLDVQLQAIADKDRPDYAVGIVMDCKTGDILAMSSYPWYDNNSIGSSTPEERLNHCVNYLFEPGSVFKVFSLCADLQAAQADFSTPFVCDGSFTFEGITINCHEKHGIVTPREMIAKSCNGAIAYWSLQTDSDKFYQTLNAFGFNRSYDIGLPSKTRAKLNDPSTWSKRSKPTISFGQELSVTALHLATAATVFANEGMLLMPNLVLQRSKGSAIGKTNDILYERKVKEQGKVVDSDIAKQLLSYMHSATQEGGTAVLCDVPGVSVSAKTGTAQILNPETNSYTDGTVLASTLALIPSDNPQYIIYIAAGNPKGDTIWGANIASPAIGKVIEGLISQGKLISDKSHTTP